MAAGRFTFWWLVGDDGRLPPHVPEGPDDGLVFRLLAPGDGGQLGLSLPRIRMNWLIVTILTTPESALIRESSARGQVDQGPISEHRQRIYALYIILRH